MRKYYLLIALCFVSSAAYALGLSPLGLGLTKNTAAFFAAPALSSQYDHPYIAWDTTTGEPEFTLECTPEVFSDPYVNDLCSHWHRMIISVDTPNDYVLGTLPVPAAQLVGGSWLMSGNDSGLSINSTTGQITLTDSDQVTVVENRAVLITTPAGGEYNIIIPVVDAASMGAIDGGSFRFYSSDGTGTDFATEGGDPNDPLGVMDQYTTGNVNPETNYFKRGSVWPNARLDIAIGYPTDRNFLDYGDPSEPRPRFIIDSGQTTDGAFTNYASTPYKPQTNMRVEGLDIDINGVTTQCVDAANWANFRMSRMKCSNNANDESSSGFYFNDSDYFTLRHSETVDIYGDGSYRTNTKTSELAFNKFGSPSRNEADSWQASNEGQTAQFNWDVYDHDNIGLVIPFQTGKGATVYDGCVNCLYERNWAQSSVFAIDTGDFYSTFRHSFLQGHPGMLTTNGVLLNGGSQSSGAISTYGNLVLAYGRGYQVTGHYADIEGWQGDEYNRADLETSLNVFLNPSTCMRFDQPFTGLIEQNYCINYLTDLIYDIKGDASYEGTITDISVSGQDMTLTLGELAHIPPNYLITIVGASNGDNNVSNVRATYLEYNSLLVTAPSGTPVNESGGSITYTATPDYTTKVYRNNLDAAPSEADMPTLSASPTFTGTVREGETVTCSASVPSGHTATYFWHINGVINQDMSGAAAEIPLLSEGIDPRKPDLLLIGKDVNYNDLGCMVEIANDTTGYKNLYTAVNSSGHFATRIQNYIEGLDDPALWVRPSDLRPNTAVASLSDKFEVGDLTQATGTAQPAIEYQSPQTAVTELSFDGGDHLANDALAADFSAGRPPLTAHVTFQADNTTGIHALFAFANSADNDPYIRLAVRSGDFQYTKSDNGGSIEHISIATADTNKHTISIQDNGETINVLMDGVLVLEDEAISGSVSGITLDTFNIGALDQLAGVANYLTGDIENIAIFSSAHSDEEFETSHNSFLSQSTGQPSAPLSLECSGADQEIACLWYDPTFRTSEITDFKIEYDCGGGYLTFADGTSDENTASITGLTNGVACNVRVSATNDNGYGPVSNVVSATPQGSGVTELSDLISGVVACWHGDVYSGSGDWLNQTGTPADAESQATYDITPSNTALHSGDVWTMNDSDNFDLGTNTSFIQNLAKTTGGTDWTILARLKTATSYATIDSILATASENGDYGLGLRVDSSGNFKVDQYDGSSTVTQQATATLSANAYHNLAVKYGSGNLGFAVNADTFETVASGWTGSISNAATDPLKIASEGDGTSAMESDVEIHSICIVNDDISNADLATWNDWSEGRYPADPPSAPDAPISLAGMPSDGGIHLAWWVTDNGGDPITDYTIQYDCGSGYTTFADGTSTVPETLITGRTNGVECDVRVSATNSIGTSAYSSSIAVTPQAEGTNPYDETEWKITEPVDQTTAFRSGTDAREILAGAIGTYESPWFGRVGDEFWYQCTYPGARTSSNATYSRSELRGLTGGKDFEYDDDAEDEVEFSVTECPTSAGSTKTIVHQIHSDTLANVKMNYDCRATSGTDGIRLLMKLRDDDTVDCDFDGDGTNDGCPTLKSGITRGDWTRSKLVWDGDGSDHGGQQTLEVYIDNVLVWEQAFEITDAGGNLYFKKGNYCQAGPLYSLTMVKHRAPSIDLSYRMCPVNDNVPEYLRNPEYEWCYRKAG